MRLWMRKRSTLGMVGAMIRGKVFFRRLSDHPRRLASFRRILAIAVPCGGLAVGVVVHAAAATAPHSDQGRAGHSTRKAAIGMDAYPQQASLFLALRQPASTPAPSLMALAEEMAAADGQSPSPSGLQPTLLRMVYADGDTISDILPTTRGVCLVAVVGGAGIGACASTATAAQNGIVVQQNDGQSSVVVGVLPDGATDATIEISGGSELAVSLNSENGFAMPVDQPKAFAYSDDGSVHTVDLESSSVATSAQQG